MTRIKKRRSGKKRTADRKKASAGRRGARAIKKEKVDHENKDRPTKPVAGATNDKGNGAVKQAGGKARSAGARRIAAAKSIVKADKSTDKKAAGAKKTNEDNERPAKKGFAPWNKNKFKRKEK